MNLKTVSEMLSATTIGASFGLWMYDCKSQGQATRGQILVQVKPDKIETTHRNASPEITAVFCWTVIALLAFVLFKILAATFYGVLSSIFSKGEAA